MFPKMYPLFGNGSEFGRPGKPVGVQLIARFAMAGILAALLVTALLKIRGIG